MPFLTTALGCQGVPPLGVSLLSTQQPLMEMKLERSESPFSLYSYFFFYQDHSSVLSKSKFTSFQRYKRSLCNETLLILLTPLPCPVFHSYFWLQKWLCALFTSDYNKILIPWEKVSKTSPENSVSCCLPFCWKSPVLRERCAPYSHPQKCCNWWLFPVVTNNHFHLNPFSH